MANQSMALLVFTIAVVLLADLAAGQNNLLRMELASDPVIKINGIYRRGSCSCLPPQSCDDNFDTLYTVVEDTQLGQLEMSPYSVAFRPRLYGTFASNSSGVISFGVNGLTCDGTLVRSFVCKDSVQTEYCKVRFDCVQGECFVSQVSKDLRTYVFPVAFAFVIVLLSCYGGFVYTRPLSSENIKIVFVEGVLRFLAIMQFFSGIFLLFGPGAFYGLMFLATATFIFHSRAHVQTDLLLDVILAIWGLFTLGGSNVMTSDIGLEVSALFNVLGNSYDANECFLLYGVPIGDNRCGMFLMFQMFATFLLLLIQAPLFLFAAYLWTHPVRRGSDSILYKFYGYFGVVYNDDQQPAARKPKAKYYTEQDGDDSQFTKLEDDEYAMTPPKKVPKEKKPRSKPKPYGKPKKSGGAYKSQIMEPLSPGADTERIDDSSDVSRYEAPDQGQTEYSDPDEAYEHKEGDSYSDSD